MKKKVIYLSLQLCACLCLFFAIAVFVFLLRNKDSRSFIMPNLVNKNFLNIYDELQRLELRIKLSRRQYKDLPAGLILSQSPLPGQKTQAHDNLHLTINQALPFLTMPDLRSRSLAYARSSIERLPAGDSVYALKIASVSKLYTNKFPHNTIISQFPPAGELVSEQENVYLLLALRKKDTSSETKEDRQADKDKNESEANESDKARDAQEKDKKDSLSRQALETWLDQNFSIASHYFHHQKIDYRIRRFILSKSKKQNGQIYKISRTRQNTLLLDIYYHQGSAKRGRSGYERVQIELDREGPCLVESIALNQKSSAIKGERQYIFSTREHKEDEEVEILFYRQGAMRLEAKCGGEEVYRKNFYPKSMS